MKKILPFLMVFLPFICLSQQALSTLQRAPVPPGSGYTIYTKSNGVQTYVLFTSALDSAGVNQKIDSLFQLVDSLYIIVDSLPDLNGIISALPLGSVSINAMPSANFFIDSLGLVRYRSRGGTAESVYFQSNSLSAPTTIYHTNPADTSQDARIILDGDGISYFKAKEGQLRTPDLTGSWTIQLQDSVYVLVQDTVGFGVKFYQKYWIPNDTPSDGDVIVFNADGTSQFSAFPSGVNLGNSDLTQTDATRDFDSDGQVTEFVNSSNFLIESEDLRLETPSSGLTPINITNGGTILMKINIGESFVVTDANTSGDRLGIRYNSDYCDDILTNPRSIPDVSCVAQLVSDSLADAIANLGNSNLIQTDAIRTFDSNDGELDFINNKQFYITSKDFAINTATSVVAPFEVSGSGLINARINDGATATITEYNDLGAQFGLQYGGDYCDDILTNPRSIPDVSCVETLIASVLDTLAFAPHTIYNHDDTIFDGLRTVYISDGLLFTGIVSNQASIYINPGNDGVQLGIVGGSTGTNLTLDTGGNEVSLRGTTSTSATLKLKEGTTNGTNYIGIKAPNSITTDATLVLPSNNTTAGALTNDGAGNLTWNSSLLGTAIGGTFSGTTDASTAQLAITLPGVPSAGACVVSNNALAGATTRYIYSIVYGGGTSATIFVYDVDSFGACTSCAINVNVICR